MRTRILTAAAPALAVAIASIAVACGSTTDRQGFAEQTEDGGTSSGSAGFDPSKVDSATPSCATAEANTIKPPVDFIFSIDQSGSMSDETSALQTNVNTLAQLLKDSGLDYRLVMIAGKPGNGSLPVCVPPPLGGPSCANNDPTFRHANQHIESWDTLKLIVDTFKLTGGDKAWRDALRENALKVFVPITDDRSQDMTAQAFDANILSIGGKLMGDDVKRNYVMYPIIGAADFPSETKCGSNAVNEGPEYIQLAKLTGGKWFSICNPDFKKVFTEIGKTVNAAVACELAIPTVEGQELDATKVNVTIKDKDGKPVEQLAQDNGDCANGADGWQFSSDNKKVLLCGNACETVKKNPDFKTVVEFGCATRVK